jgi:UDP-N-acetylmuramate dehydrogenase
LRELALLAAEHGWQGLEFAYGIPGTLGGAIRMNAGAYGGNIGDFVKEVRLYCTETDQVLTLGGDELAFSYRHSALTDHAEWVCLSATLELAVQASDDRSLQERQGDIRAAMEEMRRRRRDTQPLTYPSAGSVFKRPEGHFAGKLIEDCGLKGKSIGGAQISEKHAGFIINRGGATAADVRALIRLIQAEVMDRFGVALEEEIVLIDNEK